MFTEKMQLFCVNRANGLRPLDAAIAAGYAPTGGSVTASRMEARKDVQTEIARLKKRGDARPSVDVPTSEASGAPWRLKDKYASPLELMRDVMNNPKAPLGIRIQCAKDVLPYCHARKEGGKKEAAADIAKKIAGKGRYASTPAPLRKVSG